MHLAWDSCGTLLGIPQNGQIRGGNGSGIG
jgi:hypothetical protein